MGRPPSLLPLALLSLTVVSSPLFSLKPQRPRCPQSPGTALFLSSNFSFRRACPHPWYPEYHPAHCPLQLLSASAPARHTTALILVPIAPSIISAPVRFTGTAYGYSQRLISPPLPCIADFTTSSQCFLPLSHLDNLLHHCRLSQISFPEDSLHGRSILRLSLKRNTINTSPSTTVTASTEPNRF